MGGGGAGDGGGLGILFALKLAPDVSGSGLIMRTRPRGILRIRLRGLSLGSGVFGVGLGAISRARSGGSERRLTP
jgi:hypothetical protein